LNIKRIYQKSYPLNLHLKNDKLEIQFKDIEDIKRFLSMLN